MSKVVPISKRSDVMEQASLWIAKLDRQLNKDEELKLQAWMAEDPSHAQTLFKMAKLWDKMDAVERLNSLFPRNTEKSNAHWWMGIAASALLLLSIGGWQMSSSDSPTYIAQQILTENMYVTGIGEQRTVQLNDGSTLRLNTDSSVRVTFTDKQRAIELERGEIYIDVAHNTDMPLSVYANEQVIQAVGTAFNVQLDTQTVELIVTDGKVRVSQSGESIADPMRVSRIFLPADAPAISAGEKWNIGSNEKAKAIVESDLQASLSWQQGELIFRGESLAQVMEEVARYTPYEFSIRGDELAATQVAGLFKTDDVDALLDALEVNIGLTWQRIGPQHIELAKR